MTLHTLDHHRPQTSELAKLQSEIIELETLLAMTSGEMHGHLLKGELAGRVCLHIKKARDAAYAKLEAIVGGQPAKIAIKNGKGGVDS